MKKPLILVPLAFISIPVQLTLWYMTSFGYSFNESIQCVLHFVQNRTRYAQKFSEPNLARITPGMTGDQVFKLIGQPLEGHIRDGKPGSHWKYSLAEGTASVYHERTIVFDLPPNAPPKVSEVIKRLHLPTTD
jgi:hypothetical protein